MMSDLKLVQFRTNLGSKDANRLGLNYVECLGGAKVQVPSATAKALCAGGFADDVTPPVVPLKAVLEKDLEAAAPAKTESKQKS